MEESVPTIAKGNLDELSDLIDKHENDLETIRTIRRQFPGDECDIFDEIIKKENNTIHEIRTKIVLLYINQTIK